MPLRITTAYTAQYTDPISVRAGDIVAVGKRDPDNPGWIWCTNSAGKSGWTPESILQISGTQATLLRDYHAVELSVNVDDELTVLARESGWLWCKNSTGLCGWIPQESAQEIP